MFERMLRDEALQADQWTTAIAGVILWMNIAHQRTSTVCLGLSPLDVPNGLLGA